MSQRATRSYALEFKQSSAKLALESNQPMSQTAHELGIHTTTLYGWVQRYGGKMASTTGKV